MSKEKEKQKLSFIPFILSAAIIALDQLTKILVAKNIPENSCAFSLWNDFFMLVHQKNTGAAFSMGDSFSGVLRFGTMIFLPLCLMIFIIIYYVKTTDLSKAQRWALCAIVGGGIGNLIDRIFRPDGVVDFLSFKFFGIFGWERFPTFNVADSSIVIACVIIIFSSLSNEVKNKKNKESAN